MLDLLAIAAHPDDVEQTCGGTVLRMAEAGYRTGIIDLTAGDMGTRGSPKSAWPNRRKRRGCSGWRIAKTCICPTRAWRTVLAVRMTLARRIRELRPRTVILPYWEGRHPDHYRASEIGYEACFLAGLRKLDPETEPHRPDKIIYASMYANVTPTFVVDITRILRQAHGIRCWPIDRSTAQCRKGQRCSRTKRKSASGWPRWPGFTAT